MRHFITVLLFAVFACGPAGAAAQATVSVPIKLDTQPVTGTTLIGEGALDVGSARFLVRPYEAGRSASDEPADPDTADIPVIVVSADATQARITEAIAAGATHYLTKPVNVPQFLAALDEMLEQLDTHFG